MPLVLKNLVVQMRVCGEYHWFINWSVRHSGCRYTNWSILGAVIAELIVERRTFGEAVKSGVGSLVGFLTSTLAKAVIQIVMIVVFFIAIFLL